MNSSISPRELRQNISVSTFMGVLLKLKPTISSNRKDFSNHFNLGWAEQENINFVTIDDRLCVIDTYYRQYRVAVREVIEWYFIIEGNL